MNRDRTDEDEPLEDAPDWFDAGVTEDVATPATDERGLLDDDEVGDWFTEPDHQPVGPDAASADAAVEDPPTPDTEEADEENRTIADEIAGTIGTAAGTPPSVDDELSETPDPEFDSSAGEPTPDPSRVNTVDEMTDAVDTPQTFEENGTETAETGTTETATEAPPSATEETAGTTVPESASSASEPVPEPDEGTVDDATDATTRPTPEERGTGTAETVGGVDAEGTGSPVHRLVAWLRSVFGR